MVSIKDLEGTTLTHEPGVRGPLALLPQPGPEPEVPEFFRDVVPAAFIAENPPTNVLRRATGPQVERGVQDPDFDPFEAIAGTRYEEFPEAFIWADNPEDVAIIEAQIDGELEAWDTLSKAGIGGMLAIFAAAATDPIIFLPIGGQAIGTAKTGANFLRGALSVGRAGLLASTAAEVVLQETQYTRTFGQSAMNVTAATFLSGILGGSIGAVVGKRAALMDEIKRDMRLDPRIVKTVPDSQAGRVGFARLIELNEAVQKFRKPTEAGGVHIPTVGRLAELDAAVAKYRKVVTAEGPSIATPARLAELDELVDQFRTTAVERGQVSVGRLQEIEEAIQRMKEDIGEGPPGVTETGTVRITDEMLEGDTSVGAASVGATKAELELRSSLGFIKAIKKWTPLLRTATSRSLEVRRVVQELAETPFEYVGKGMKLTGDAAVETLLKLWTAPLGRSLELTDAAYVEYRTGLVGKGGRLRRAGLALKPDKDKLTYRQFREEVSHAIRNEGKHPIPQVARVAQTWKKMIFEAAKDEAIATKLLPKGVQPRFAMSYLMRVYNIERINARQPEFIDMVKKWLLRTNKDLDALDAEDIAEQITERILNEPDGRIQYEPIKLERGPLKERTLSVPDHLLAPWLENDIEIIARFFLRTLPADIELTRRFGSADMSAQIAKIKTEYTRKIAAAPDDKARLRLGKERRNDIRDVAFMRDMIRGTYVGSANPNSVPSRAMRVVRHGNVLSQGGGFLISSWPDVARTIMVHGLVRTLGSGLLPMIANFKAFKLAAAEVKLAGTAWDLVLDTRALALADIGDQFGRGNKFERGLQGLTRNYFLINMLAPWNTAMKQFAGVVTQATLLDAAKAFKAGKATPMQIRKLRLSRINEAAAIKIADQFDKFGSTERGVKLANTAGWDSREALRAFRAAIVKDVDTIIVTPGVGDRPMWMSTEIGKMLGQYKSFAFAATQRVALLGLQQRDLASLNGLILSIGLGMMVYGTKTLQGHGTLSASPAVWLGEGLDRSGVIGAFADINGILDRVSRGTLGINSILGGPTMSRYQSRVGARVVLGPSFARIEDMMKILGSAFTGEFKRSDLRAIQRFAFYQNVFYFRSLVDKMTTGVGDAIGLPPEPPRRVLE